MDKLVNILDSVGKAGAGIAVLIVIIGTAFPPVSKYTKAMMSWRFGVNGVVKYELGTEGSANQYPERKPTSQGQLYFLGAAPIGMREWQNLSFGDVLQAKSQKHLRLEDACGEHQNCGSSPRIFTLLTGQCVVVLGRLYPDTSTSNSLAEVQGGWLKVATTSCGIFN